MKTVRTHVPPEALPILVFTALGTFHHTQAALVGGANAFLAKPFDPSKFLATVEKLLAEKTGPRAEGGSA